MTLEEKIARSVNGEPLYIDAARALTDEHEYMQDLRQGAPRHGVHLELLDQCQEQDMPRVRGRKAAHENAEEA